LTRLENLTRRASPRAVAPPVSPLAAPRGRGTLALNTLLTLLLGTILAYAVFFLSSPIAQTDRAGREYRNIYLLVLGIIGLAHTALSFSFPSSARRGMSRILVRLALLLPGYAALQLVPLPLSFLRVVSPQRAELLNSLTPLGLRPSWAPLSVAPPLTLEHFLLFAGYAVVFFAVRDLALSSRDKPWLPVMPIVAIAVWQAAWGLTQFLEGGAEAFAHGTYLIRNHFSGFLEMALPFPVAYGAAVLAQNRGRGGMTGAAALRTGLALQAAALILVGIVCSLSRMGLAAVAGSLVSITALALSGRFKPRIVWSVVAALCVVIVLGMLLLAPAQMILRFADISSEDRFNVWRDTLHLVAAYPIFGCGLGGYESAFEKFRTSSVDVLQIYAHNDYLQYLAELGIAGIFIASGFLALIGFRSVRAGLLHRQSDSRWLGLACAGSLAAIFIHSLADYNLYVVANASLLAWICGLVAAIPFSATPGRSTLFRRSSCRTATTAAGRPESQPVLPVNQQ